MLICLAAVSSCSLTESPKSSAGVSLVFGSETGLRSYCYSFYGMLPSGSDAHHQDDELADYIAKTSFDLYETGALTPDPQGSWDWSSIQIGRAHV